MAVKTYDLNRVVVTIDGVRVTGWADGDAVTVVDAADYSSLQIGSDGEGARSVLNNRSGSVTMNLLYSSLSNNQLTAIHAQDQISGMRSFMLQIVDLNSGTQVLIPDAHIARAPDVTLGREMGSRTWRIDYTQKQVTDLGIVGGGGPSV